MLGTRPLIPTALKKIPVPLCVKQKIFFQREVPKKGLTASNSPSKTWDQQTLNTKPECITRDMQIIYPHPNETANRGFLKK